VPPVLGCVGLGFRHRYLVVVVDYQEVAYLGVHQRLGVASGIRPVVLVVPAGTVGLVLAGTQPGVAGTHLGFVAGVGVV